MHPLCEDASVSLSNSFVIPMNSYEFLRIPDNSRRSHDRSQASRVFRPCAIPRCARVYFFCLSSGSVVSCEAMAQHYASRPVTRIGSGSVAAVSLAQVSGLKSEPPTAVYIEVFETVLALPRLTS